MTTPMAWGSDAVAHLLRDLAFPYVALVPGSSYRGLHDSLVNYLDAGAPTMLVCLHEEHSVAIAHGYAKVTGKPLLVIVHANVGLMHASMTMYGAYCDRVPMLIIGANGPNDASKRRPWIDWVHSSRDPAAMVRHFTKWDAEPGSVDAALEAVLRAYQITMTPPFAPTLVVLDVGLQETALADAPTMPEPRRFGPPGPPDVPREDLERAAALMRTARRRVLILGRMTRDLDAWNARVALAEALGAEVVTDLQTGATFPTDHPLHLGRPAAFVNAESAAALRCADVILALDVPDLAGTLKQALGAEAPAATIINCSVDRYVHNGWSMDHQALPPVDLSIAATPDTLVRAMLAELRREAADKPAAPPTHAAVFPSALPVDGTAPMDMDSFLAGLSAAFAGRDVCYIRLPLGAYHGVDLVFRHPLDCLGGDGAGDIGAGPGLAVGAALALKGTGRLAVAVLGDGDYLMGLTALWTAAANDIPLLVVVANNHCYNNDVQHQERMARVRARPLERKWIGQMLTDPTPDLAMLARGQGAVGLGLVEGRAALALALEKGIQHVDDGRVCVIDCYVSP